MEDKMLYRRTHKAQHKEGCAFDDFLMSLNRHNQNTSEEILRICDTGLEYTNDDHHLGGDCDKHVLFRFCPVCGCPYEINEDIEEDN